MSMFFIIEKWDNYIGNSMLQEHRIKRKISREKLARLSGVDARTIYRIEKNISMPLVDTYAKIVMALGLTKEEIYNDIKNIAKENSNNVTEHI